MNPPKNLTPTNSDTSNNVEPSGTDNVSDDNNIFQQALDSVVWVLEKIKDLYANRHWLTLSIFLVVVIFILFEPNSGILAKTIPGEKPVLYNTMLWAFSSALLLLGILLELLKFILYKNKNKKITIFSVITLTTVVAFLILNFSYQSIKAKARPSYYLQCIRSSDCFSWGENTLFSYGYFEDKFNLDIDSFVPGNELLSKGREINWQKKCRRAWRLKSAATSLYHTEKFEEAITRFSNECKTDAESQVYLNNIRAIADDRFRLWPFPGRASTGVGIAVSLPISREGGESVSQEILRGVALAQREANADSQLAGVNFLVGIADDGFDNQSSEGPLLQKESAKKIAKSLAAMSEVVAVIGHFSSDATAEAGVNVYDSSKSNLVAISPTSTTVRKGEFSAAALHKDTGVDLGDRVFRTALSERSVIYQLVDELLSERSGKEKYTKVAVIYEGISSYSNSFKEAFENIFVGEKGGAVLSQPSVCDFSANANYQEKKCLDAIKEQGMEALLLIPSTKSSKGIRDLIIENSRRDKLPLFGADSMYDASFLAESTDGMMIFIPWHWDFQDRGSEDFINQAEEMFDTSELNWRSAMAYDAAQVIVQGVRDTSSKYCSTESLFSRIGGQSKRYTSCIRENLARILEDSNFRSKGVLGDGTVSFKHNHDRDVSGRRLGTFVQVKKDGDIYVFSSLYSNS